MNNLPFNGNPQQMVMNMLQSTSQNNPFLMNLLMLAKGGNKNEIETIARNIMREKGLDFDKEFNNFMRAMGFLNK